MTKMNPSLDSRNAFKPKLCSDIGHVSEEYLWIGDLIFLNQTWLYLSLRVNRPRTTQYHSRKEQCLDQYNWIDFQFKTGYPGFHKIQRSKSVSYHLLHLWEQHNHHLVRWYHSQQRCTLWSCVISYHADRFSHEGDSRVCHVSHTRIQQWNCKCVLPWVLSV
jgi:hypothetical protein